MRNITETTGGFLSNQPIYTYSIQSSDVNNSAADAHISQENVTFADADSGKIMEMPLTIDQCQIDDSSSVELGAFLSRPVLIQTFTWQEGFALSEEFSPWLNYFNNTVIRKKLDNYYLLRCNLHLKVVLNESQTRRLAATTNRWRDARDGKERTGADGRCASTGSHTIAAVAKRSRVPLR
jgi:hypothetical protein